jgi:restriction system protein
LDGYIGRLANPPFPRNVTRGRTVSAGHIRDFRGAMVGRADNGLFITTGTFTRDAIREATRDVALPIDLIDGDQLADKLRELDLGIRTEIVEKVAIDENWFVTL